MPVALGGAAPTLRWLDGGAVHHWRGVPGRVATTAGRAERYLGHRSIVAWPAARHDERNLDTTGNHHR